MIAIVTADKFELILAVRDTKAEIARLLDVEISTVCRSITRGAISINKFNGHKYKIIEIDEKEDNHA